MSAGSAVPDSFGNVTAEYLALRRECGLVPGRWEVVWVEGPDAVAFLQGLVSADVEGLSERGVCRSFLLTPRGMVRFSLWVLKVGDKLGLVCGRDEGPDLSETLEYYRIRVKATVRLDPRPVSALVGPTAPWTTTLEQGRWESIDEDFRASAPLAGTPRVFFTGEAPGGIGPVGELAWRAVRVESGEPEVGLDLDDRTIPQETGELADAAISFDKGCYLGQELAARIDSRGRVNRTLRGLEVRTNLLPPEGAEVRDGERKVGRITSVAESLELMAPVGLSLIRRGTDPGDEVRIRWQGGEAPARVRVLPLVDA
ncbi:MAG: hypothetical protein OXM62_04875 [bacterium]|nr:hypothetical protein [bacterium]